MRPSLRPKLTYSNVIATIALFLALGGAALAAGLPRNSVGPKQLKRGAVIPAKLRRGAVTSPKLGLKSVTTGKIGPSAVLPGNIVNGGITASKLASGAVIAQKIKNGVITTNKLANESVTLAKLGKEVAPLLGTLRAGQTLRGSFDLGGEVGGAGKLLRSGQSFQFPLANAPAAPEANVLLPGTTSTACPGLKGGGEQTPEAAAGQLCVYVKSSEGTTPKLAFDANAVSRLGFGLTASFGTADAKNQIQGLWAVTAP